jgi:hypothetical protein
MRSYHIFQHLPPSTSIMSEPQHNEQASSRESEDLPEELQLLAQTTSAALENIGLALEDLHEEWIGPGNSINDLVSNEQEPFRYKCQEVREALVGTLEVLSLRLASLLSRMRSMQVEIDLRGEVDEDEVYMENEETTWDDSSETLVGGDDEGGE